MPSFLSKMGQSDLVWVVSVLVVGVLVGLGKMDQQALLFILMGAAGRQAVPPSPVRALGGSTTADDAPPGK